VPVCRSCRDSSPEAQNDSLEWGAARGTRVPALTCRAFLFRRCAAGWLRTIPHLERHQMWATKKIY
jgi:hypothetical protein